MVGTLSAQLGVAKLNGLLYTKLWISCLKTMDLGLWQDGCLSYLSVTNSTFKQYSNGVASGYKNQLVVMHTKGTKAAGLFICDSKAHLHHDSLSLADDVPDSIPVKLLDSGLPTRSIVCGMPAWVHVAFRICLHPSPENEWTKRYPTVELARDELEGDVYARPVPRPNIVVQGVLNRRMACTEVIAYHMFRSGGKERLVAMYDTSGDEASQLHDFIHANHLTFDPSNGALTTAPG